MMIRAGASNREMVQAMGVNIKFLYRVVFACGVALAVLAGMIAAPVSSVYPNMGGQVLIISFVVVVIGGIGSVRGALLASLLVGLVDTFGKVFFPRSRRRTCVSVDGDDSAVEARGVVSAGMKIDSRSLPMLALLAFAAVFPFFGEKYYVDLVMKIMISVGVCVEPRVTRGAGRARVFRPRSLLRHRRLTSPRCFRRNRDPRRFGFCFRPRWLQRGCTPWQSALFRCVPAASTSSW